MKHVLLRGDLIWTALQQETTSEFDLLWEILQSPDVQGYISHEDLMALYGRIATEQDMTMAVTLLCQFRRILEVYWANPDYPIDAAIASDNEPWVPVSVPDTDPDVAVDVPVLSVSGFLARYALEKLYDADLEPFQPEGWYRKWRASGLDPLLMIPIALTLTLRTIPALQEFLVELLGSSSAPSADDWLSAPDTTSAIASTSSDSFSPPDLAPGKVISLEQRFQTDPSSDRATAEPLHPTEVMLLLTQGSAVDPMATPQPNPLKAIASPLPVHRLPSTTPAPPPDNAGMERSPMTVHRPLPVSFSTRVESQGDERNGGHPSNVAAPAAGNDETLEFFVSSDSGAEPGGRNVGQPGTPLTGSEQSPHSPKDGKPLIAGEDGYTHFSGQPGDAGLENGLPENGMEPAPGVENTSSADGDLLGHATDSPLTLPDEDALIQPASSGQPESCPDWVMAVQAHGEPGAPDHAIWGRSPLRAIAIQLQASSLVAPQGLHSSSPQLAEHWDGIGLKAASWCAWPPSATPTETAASSPWPG